MGIDFESMSESYDTAVCSIDRRLERDRQVYENRDAEYERDPAADYNIDELPYYIKFMDGGTIRVFMTETEEETWYTEHNSYEEKHRMQSIITKEFIDTLNGLNFNFAVECCNMDENTSIEEFLTALKGGWTFNNIQDAMVKFLAKWLSSYEMSKFIKKTANEAKQHLSNIDDSTFPF